MKNNNLPKITIITPTLNQGRYIESTIKSVLNQNYPDLEYIIIDGGSRDDTLDIIKKYESRVTRIISEKDKGQSNAINKGLKLASGEIINWLNSDDMLAENSLWTIGLFMLEHPDVDVLYGKCHLIDRENAITKVRRTTGYSSRAVWVASSTLCQPVTFFRRSAMKKAGPLDEELNFVMDQDLYIRFGLAGMKFQNHRSLFGYFRIHEDSKSRSLRDAMVRELDYVLTVKHNNPISRQFRPILWFWFRLARYSFNLPGLIWFNLKKFLAGKQYV